MKQKILKAFSKLPQKILWKYEGQMDGLPSNIRLISWAPQQDLLGKSDCPKFPPWISSGMIILDIFLAHPKMKVFITHGGLLSTHEAAYHGCPILVFPLSADQWGNAANALHAGFSEFLNWREFTSQELVDKIHILISDPR